MISYSVEFLTINFLLSTLVLLTQVQRHQFEWQTFNLCDGRTVEFGGRIQNEGLLDVEFRVVEEPVLIRNIA